MTEANAQAAATVLCLLEADAAGIADESLRALAFARSLPLPRLTAVVFAAPGGAPEGEAVAAELAGTGVTELFVVAAAGLTDYAPVARARSLEQLMGAGDVAAVVAAATDHGSEVLAHLGALTGLPVAANCVQAAPVGPARWRLVRQRWAGSLLEDAELDADCALLTVAADAVPADGVPDAGSGAAGGGVPTVRWVTPVLTDADLAVVATQAAEPGGGMSLSSARVVVGGGRGVGGPEGFAPLEELAALLGGVVGVSRVVTSQGWRPHRQQVGQTGTKISPELYLACGISGAIQHMAGCLSAKHIVVVNTDPEAPIIARAEYAVIGDLAEVIPALVDAIRSAGG